MNTNRWKYVVVGLIFIAIAGIPLYYAFQNQNQDHGEQTITRFFEAYKTGDADTFYSIWKNDFVPTDIRELKQRFTSDETLEFTILFSEKVNNKEYKVGVDIFSEGERAVMHYPVILVDGKWMVDVSNAVYVPEEPAFKDNGEAAESGEDAEGLVDEEAADNPGDTEDTGVSEDPETAGNIEILEETEIPGDADVPEDVLE